MGLTVKDLQKVLEDLPDDMPVVLGDSGLLLDHCNLGHYDKEEGNWLPMESALKFPDNPILVFTLWSNDY